MSLVFYFQLMGDKLFLHGVHRAVVSRLKTQSAPTYLYRFSLESSYYSLVKTVFAGKHIPGKDHSNDLIIIFAECKKYAKTKNLLFQVPVMVTTAHIYLKWPSWVQYRHEIRMNGKLSIACVKHGHSLQKPEIQIMN